MPEKENEEVGRIQNNEVDGSTLTVQTDRPLKSKLKPKLRKHSIVQARIDVDTRFLGSNIDIAIVTGYEVSLL